MTERRPDLTEYQAYFADVGQRVYESNRSRCGTKYKLIQTTDFIHFVVQKICDDHWPPETVCGYATTQHLFECEWVCTKTLYRDIDLVLLPIKNIDLPLKVSRNTKKRRTRQHKKMLGTSIEERPRHIDERLESGHLEIDTVLGTNKKGAALLPLTERKTRKEHILKIDRKTAECVKQALQIEATGRIRILNRVQNDHIRQWC